MPPINGKGGIYIGNIEAASNTELLNTLKIRVVLSLEHLHEYCYFNSKIVAHKVLRIRDNEEADIGAVF